MSSRPSVRHLGVTGNERPTVRSEALDVNDDQVVDGHVSGGPKETEVLADDCHTESVDLEDSSHTHSGVDIGVDRIEPHEGPSPLPNVAKGNLAISVLSLSGYMTMIDNNPIFSHGADSASMLGVYNLVVDIGQVTPAAAVSVPVEMGTNHTIPASQPTHLVSMMSGTSHTGFSCGGTTQYVSDGLLVSYASFLALHEANAAVTSILGSQLRACVQHNKALLCQLEQVIAESNAAVAERDASIVGRDVAVADRNVISTERDAVIDTRNVVVIERDAAIVGKDAAMAWLRQAGATADLGQQ